MQKGNKNAWKGGRYMTASGYAMIFSPHHPNKTQIGYVREHRLVMEAAIGRYLYPEEVVHHINDIRDDNRIENLLLFENERAHRAHHNKQRRKK